MVFQENVHLLVFGCMPEQKRPQRLQCLFKGLIGFEKKYQQTVNPDFIPEQPGGISPISICLAACVVLKVNG